MKFWFLTDPARFGREKRAVEALAQGEGWFVIQRWTLSAFRMSVEGVLKASGNEYPVRLVYPDQFPEVPAWVEPQDPQAKWSDHQYGAGGSLCLELRPDNWVPSATGADVLRSAYNLLAQENPLGEETARGTVPSAHAVGEVQSYGLLFHPVMLGQGLAKRLRENMAANVRALAWPVVDKLVRTLVYDDLDLQQPQRPPPPSQGMSDLPVFVSRNPHPGTTLATWSELEAAAGFDDSVAAQLSDGKSALVLFVGAERLVAYFLFGTENVFLQAVSVISDDAGARSARSAEAGAKRVAIVGLGSVGSKIAECLVRSGMTRLRLVDGDVMLPGNLERHVLDWRDVGLRKVHALKRRLLLVAPGADVEVVDDNFSWQRSAKSHAWQVESVVDCDVVVDATGDVPTALFLGAVSAANQTAFVSVVVFEGGIGALVATCRPLQDPPYSAARAAFLGWCESQNKDVPRGTGRRYEALSEDGVPIAADDAAVAVAAGHTARIVLDLLDGRSTLGDAPWLLIGLAKAWVFSGHGYNINLNVGSAVPGAAPEADQEAMAFAAALTKDALDAAANRE